MSFQVHQGGADVAAEAAAWVVRLSGETADLSDFEAFDAWLALGQDRPAAYDRALTVWSEADGVADAVVVAPLTRAQPVKRLARRWAPFAGAAMAAAVAGVVVVSSLDRPEIYTTQAGEHRTVALADGSHVGLNAGSRMEVRWARGQRNVALVAGEAAFDVAHDASRPFVIRSGERSVRVVGTEFDVKTQGEAFSVTVRRGIVDVTGARGATPVRLLKGDALVFTAAGDAGRKEHVDPDDAFAWRDGRLVFRDAPLGDVVASLNSQFGPPGIAVSPEAAKLHFSGVLRLDARDAVVRRLTLSMPVSARPTSSGIVLEMAKPPTP